MAVNKTTNTCARLIKEHQNKEYEESSSSLHSSQSSFQLSTQNDDSSSLSPITATHNSTQNQSNTRNQHAESIRKRKRTIVNKRMHRQNQIVKLEIARMLSKKINVSTLALRQYLQTRDIDIQINKEVYKRCASSVATTIIRSVERYLIVECHQQIDPLNYKIVKGLTYRILRPNLHFNAVTHRQLVTFIKFIYDLESVKIENRMVVELYRRIVQLSAELGCYEQPQRGKMIAKLDLIKQKLKLSKKPSQKNKQLKPRRQKSKDEKERTQEKLIEVRHQREKEETYQDKEIFGRLIKNIVNNNDQATTKLDTKREKKVSIKAINQQWTNQHQQLLIQSFKQSQNFCTIQSTFQQTYPHLKPVFTIDNLRNRLGKTLRRAFHCLKANILAVVESKKAVLPDLILMDTRLVKMLTRRIQPIEVRLRLIELLEGNADLKLLEWLIIHINAQMRSYNSFEYATESLSRKSAVK